MFKNPTLTVIKEDYCLNSLSYFHVTENVCVDIMQDVLEGVLILKHFIYNKKPFTSEHFNQSLVSFDYSFANEKNKPRVILNLRTSEDPIKQTASQM